MSAIKIDTYDFNISPTENLKANFLADRMAKNRWGNKFKRLYTRHMGASENNTLGIYDFTAGMRASVGTLTRYESDLLATLNFKAKLLSHFRVDTAGVWSVDGALKHSFLSVLIERTYSGPFSFLPDVEVRGVHFCLSLEGSTGKKTSFFYSSGVDDGTGCVLEPLENESDTFGLYLESDDGLAYGHYDGGLRSGSSHNTVLGLYGVEDRTDVRFDVDQEALFSDLWGELIVYAKMMAENNAPDNAGERVSVVIGLNQMIDFVDERILILESSIDDLENNAGRVSDDLELIRHLGLEETLSEEIDNVGKIKNIWFHAEKEITPPVSPPPYYEVDETYEWWLEAQFDEIRENVHNFQDYCVVKWGEADNILFNPPSVVYLKEEVFSLAGHKVYWFVNAFLDIDVKVKKRSFFKRLLGFFLSIVSIVLTILSSNPVWLKLLIITTTVLNLAGALTPEISLGVAVLTFGYGLYSVDFSSLSGVEMFKWAVKNVNMVFKMVEMHSAIGVKKEMEADAIQEAKNKSTAQLQEETMTFLYSKAYSQYDDMYNLLYDFSPKYRF